MSTMVDLYFAGLWTMVWHFGLGAGLIILCLAGAWFSPVFKSDFIYAALVVAFAMFFEYVGVHMEKVHRDAQGQVITSSVDKTVAKTETPAAKKQKDRWDNPKY